MALDSATGISFHTGMYSTLTSGEWKFNDSDEIRQEIYSEEYNKMMYMRDKLLREIRSASRVFVYKRNGRVSEDEASEIHQNLSLLNERNILLVVEADPDHQVGPHPIADRLYRAKISRLAPYERADDIDQSGWDRIVMDMKDAATERGLWP
ncbi:hypothetical protein G4G93_35200 [Methylobacterium sp. DB0501]|uniref:hypothetical protein n=1 Tax=Methylobacterium sp. DB0501 TaxID=2709665 RepID=UPI0013EB4795|nr:hypothetical protein [Methylobacterium sp. DB0501]NGM39062.1 hypothetical protein [Methylobacterium sp. DB0501]